MAYYQLNPNDSLFLRTTGILGWTLEGVFGRALVNAPQVRQSRVNKMGQANLDTLIYQNSSTDFTINRIQLTNATAVAITAALYKNAIIPPSRITTNFSIPAGGSALMDSSGLSIYDSSGNKIANLSSVNATDVVTDTTHRFTTDTQQSRWNGVVQTASPSSGETVTIGVTTTTLVITPAATIAALTLSFPVGYDGQLLTIISSQIITTITISGTSLLTTFTTAVVGTRRQFTYSTGLSKWC